MRDLEALANVKTITLEEFLGWETGFIKRYFSSAGDSFEKRTYDIVFKNGMVKYIEPAYESYEYGSRYETPRYIYNNTKFVDVLSKEEINNIDYIIETYVNRNDWSEDIEEETIYYLVNNLNINEIKENIIENIKTLNDEKILKLYYFIQKL